MAAEEPQGEVLRTQWPPQLLDTNQMEERGVKAYRVTNLTSQDPAAWPSLYHDSYQDFECNLIEEGGLDTYQCSRGLRVSTEQHVPEP